VKILFVKSNLLGSKIIRWGLNEESSHVAIQFNSLIVHSSVFGVSLVWNKSFYKHYKVVNELDYSDRLDLREEDKVFCGIMDNYDESRYDYSALIYFIFRGLLKKLFKIPFPNKNPLNEANSFLCTELISKLPKRLTVDIDYSITSPDRLYPLLKEKKGI
jgi:hypothetical protein